MIASESKHSFRFYSPSSTHSADIGKTVKKMKHSKERKKERKQSEKQKQRQKSFFSGSLDLE